MMTAQLSIYLSTAFITFMALLYAVTFLAKGSEILGKTYVFPLLNVCVAVALCIHIRGYRLNCCGLHNCQSVGGNWKSVWGNLLGDKKLSYCLLLQEKKWVHFMGVFVCSCQHFQHHATWHLFLIEGKWLQTSTTCVSSTLAARQTASLQHE